MLMHKSQYHSLHDYIPCIEVVSLEFNTLHGTRVYGHSSAKVYFESYHSDNEYFDCCV